MNYENQIDEILSSIDGMQRAIPPDGLADRVFDRISTRGKRAVWLLKLGVAAAVAVLVVNIATMVHCIHQNQRADKSDVTGNNEQETIESTTIYTY